MTRMAGLLEGLLLQKNNRIHWDLNTLMEEWAEPYVETFNSQINDPGSVLDDGGKVHSLSCGLVSSDPHGIQLRTFSFDPERRILQECSGTVGAEKINSSASMLVQYEKDISRTSSTELGKSSLQSGQAKKIDVVSRLSTDMLILDKPVCNAYGIKSKDGEDFGRTSGEDPTNCSSKAYPSSYCNCSDISQDNRGSMVSKASYDSPIEDGELRESGVSRGDLLSNIILILLIKKMVIKIVAGWLERLHWLQDLAKLLNNADGIL